MENNKDDSIILSVDNLSVSFTTSEGAVSAVNNLSFQLKKGQRLAVVGESGSGKSQSFLSMMGLLAKNGQASGEAKFDNKNLVSLSNSALDKIRGQDISMIFQDPMTSLNPSMTVEKQLSEVLIKHQNLSRSQAREHVLSMLEKVGIPEPKKRLKAYPHELSGGMRQRIMIAMALLCQPKILIADEPTTALDVTIQAQILDLFEALTSELDTALILITHDLGVVAGLCDYILVMYGGRVVEQGSVEDIFESPQHPYTLGLLQSTPNIHNKVDKLSAIPGSPPNLQNLPKGCAFQPRCPFHLDKCLDSVPQLERFGLAEKSESGEKTVAAKERKVACFYQGLTNDMAEKFIHANDEVI